ncbi:carbohydrate-binding protein [Oerskovia sp. M15]
MPIAQFSNVIVTIGSTSYSTTYDHPAVSRSSSRSVPPPAAGRAGPRGTTGGSTGTPGTCAAPAWSTTATYSGGNVVSHGGHTWTAKYWNQERLRDPSSGEPGPTPACADVLSSSPSPRLVRQGPRPT